MTKKEYDMKIGKAINRYYDTLEKCNPFNVTSAYVACRSCGSKLNREYMAKNYLHVRKIKCPVCGSETGLYSKTFNERIDKAKAHYDKIKIDKAKAHYDKIKDSENTIKEDTTTALSYTLKDVIKTTEDRFDYILEEHKTSDFTEIVGNIGGDVLTFRVYKDGSVYEQ